MTVSDASRSAAPPPLGNTLARCAGLPVCASALESGDRNARPAIAHARSLDTADMDTTGMAVSFHGPFLPRQSYRGCRGKDPTSIRRVTPEIELDEGPDGGTGILALPPPGARP